MPLGVVVCFASVIPPRGLSQQPAEWECGNQGEPVSAWGLWGVLGKTVFVPFPAYILRQIGSVRWEDPAGWGAENHKCPATQKHPDTYLVTCTER